MKEDGKTFILTSMRINLTLDRGLEHANFNILPKSGWYKKELKENIHCFSELGP